MLAVGVFKRRLDELSHLREIYLSGGEPFEHPSVTELARLAAQNADTVVIYSSGVINMAGTAASFSQAVARDVLNAGATRIDFSVYDDNSTGHDAVTRTPGSFERLCLSLRRARGVGLKVGFHFVWIGQDPEALLRVASLASREAVQRVHVLALVAQGRGAKLPPVRDDAFLRCLAVLQDSGVVADLVLSSVLRWKLGQRHPSLRDTWRPVVFGVDGYVYPAEGARSRSHRSDLPFTGDSPMSALLSAF